MNSRPESGSGWNSESSGIRLGHSGLAEHSTKPAGCWFNFCRPARRHGDPSARPPPSCFLFSFSSLFLNARWFRRPTNSTTGRYGWDPAPARIANPRESIGKRRNFSAHLHRKRIFDLRVLICTLGRVGSGSRTPIWTMGFLQNKIII